MDKRVYALVVGSWLTQHLRMKMDSQQIEEKVLLALEEIRPFLASDGGDISLVSIENDKKVKVQLHGACVSCTVDIGRAVLYDAYAW